MTALVIALAITASHPAQPSLFPRGAAPADTASLHHPAIVLLDEGGTPVARSGASVSPMRTCGACHDTGYIASHNYHAAAGFDEPDATRARAWDSGPGAWGRWNPLTYRRLSRSGDADFDLGAADWVREFGARHTGGGPAVAAAGDAGYGDVADASGVPRAWDWSASGTAELDCFICHLPDPDNAARSRSLERGSFAWAATATLARTGLVRRDGDRWAWNGSRFDRDGRPSPSAFDIVAPSSRHCGACHGLVHYGDDPVEPRYGLGEYATETAGQIFSPQRIVLSAMNVAGKDTLTRPWDVHAERLLECTSCHNAPNNPAYAGAPDPDRPRHLSYDARRQDIAAYLRRPDHNFAKGHSAQGTVADHLDGGMRRCEDCHDARSTHTWLPYTGRHLSRLMCESCHIPRVYAPARRATDWTVLLPGGGPRIEYRGVRGTPGDPTELIETYRPVLLPRADADGSVRLGPYQLSTSWFWVTGDPPRPVTKHDLERAFFDGGRYHPDIVAAFDTDGDTTLREREMKIDSEVRLEAVRARLEAVGVDSPHIVAELQPFGLHHDVAAGAWATRDCATCHDARSTLSAPVELSSVAPGGVLPVLVADANLTAAGTMELDDGAVVFTPDASIEGFYILGHDRWHLADTAGVALILIVLAGALVHGGVRYRYARTNGGRR